MILTILCPMCEDNGDSDIELEVEVSPGPVIDGLEGCHHAPRYPNELTPVQRAAFDKAIDSALYDYAIDAQDRADQSRYDNWRDKDLA